MTERERPIGILDSGIGGFSVVRQVQRLLPGEELLYFGDGAHVPYGNHPAQKIVALARYMFRFMQQRRVKALLVACNTISCVAEQCMDLVSCPVFNAVQAGADAVAALGVERVGVISTVFTHNCRTYPREILARRPGEVRVYSCGCPHLARLVEHSLGDGGGMAQVEEELRRALDPMVERQGIQCCLLGCTHYPLVADRIRKLYPALELLDPAVEMAAQLRQALRRRDLLRPGEEIGGVSIYTTGDVKEYALRAQQVGLKRVRRVEAYPPLELD